jgi:predicted nucleic acid-binding protein
MPAQIVLDTQSVLDWMVFDDPCCRAWTSSMHAQSWHWVGTTAMLEELDRILARGFGSRWRFDRSEVMALATDRIQVVAKPPRCTLPELRCSDPDDQVFVDLAVALRAQALVSRDLAVLRLHRKAWLLLALPILPPRDWAPPAAQAPKKSDPEVAF